MIRGLRALADDTERRLGKADAGIFRAQGELIADTDLITAPVVSASGSSGTATSAAASTWTGAMARPGLAPRPGMIPPPPTSSGRSPTTPSGASARPMPGSSAPRAS
jgi:hypothetical protein